MQVGMTVLHTLGKALIADPIYQYILFTVPSPGLPPGGNGTGSDRFPLAPGFRRIYPLQRSRYSSRPSDEARRKKGNLDDS